MSFLQSYKRLDNLCKDLLNSTTGITNYIEEMESCGYRKNRIQNWDTDYQKLKRYRYIRNQIVHEDYANENNMCTKQDEEWLIKFYDRICAREDPLALYRNEMIQTKKNYIPNENYGRVEYPYRMARREKKSLWGILKQLFRIM